MNRRLFAVAAFAALTSASAYAAGPAHTEETALPRPKMQLRALFERAPGVIVEDENGLTAGPTQVGVVLLRIGRDGERVTACVDSEPAAHRFLEAPIARVDRRGAKAQ